MKLNEYFLETSCYIFRTRIAHDRTRVTRRSEAVSTLTKDSGKGEGIIWGEVTKKRGKDTKKWQSVMMALLSKGTRKNDSVTNLAEKVWTHGRNFEERKQKIETTLYRNLWGKELTQKDGRK